MQGKCVLPRDVFYVGMTNSAGGLRARLAQFQRAIAGNHGHRSGDRFFRICAKSKPFSRIQTRHRFFYATLPVSCESRKANATPEDFRKMGDVARLEYEAVACVLEKVGRLPKLNDLAKGSLAGIGFVA
jgi:hypothetical protein